MGAGLILYISRGCGFDSLHLNGCGFDTLQLHECGFDTLHLNAHGLHTRDEGVTRDRPVARRREGERKRIRTVKRSDLTPAGPTPAQTGQAKVNNLRPQTLGHWSNYSSDYRETQFLSSKLISSRVKKEKAMDSEHVIGCTFGCGETEAASDRNLRRLTWRSMAECVLEAMTSGYLLSSGDRAVTDAQLS
ncbi:hypothetical protein RRG08_066449 [Elysia crispata]|uniref:Uncharacterized protein n=1 Tax=Elysia crispata TaxID=231223 RepID=A0AAE0XNN1_9GAST|nr:hypothetical protein RRG08_066449 [Elysia crispata]